MLPNHLMNSSNHPKSYTMKLSNFIFVAAFIMALSSCINLPDLNPGSNDNIIIRSVGWEWPVPITSSQLNFDDGLDINDDGTIDFRFIGTSFTDPVLGSVHLVKIEGAAPGNEVTGNYFSVETVCGHVIPMATLQLLQPNFAVANFTAWRRQAALYWSVPSFGECSEYMIYTDNTNSGQHEYIGIKFVDNGNIHYGWIELICHEFTTTGIPGSPERWRINRVGYNDVANNGLRVPS